MSSTCTETGFLESMYVSLFVFVCLCAVFFYIRDLVNGFLDGLRKRSKFVIALMDYQSPGVCVCVCACVLVCG